MSDNTTMKPLSLALSAAFATSLAAGAYAVENPFGQSELPSGYLLAESGSDKTKTEGKCGEGKCGAMTKPTTGAKTTMEGKCGEGKCGAMTQSTADTKSQTEGKCGAGKLPMEDTGKAE